MHDGQIRRREFLARACVASAGVVHLLPAALAGTVTIPRPTVGHVRHVGTEGEKYFEPWIAGNPRDASNLVIVGSHILDGFLHREPVAWFTTDGGATWSAGEIEGKQRLADEYLLRRCLRDLMRLTARHSACSWEAQRRRETTCGSIVSTTAAGAGRGQRTCLDFSTIPAWLPTCIRANRASLSWQMVQEMGRISKGRNRLDTAV